MYDSCIQCINNNCGYYNGANLQGAFSFKSAWCGFFHHHWCWGTKRGMLVASPLCCRSNLNPRYLLRLMLIMPFVLLRWVYLFQSLASHLFPYVGACYDVCFLLSGSNVYLSTLDYQCGAQSLGFAPPQPLRVYSWLVYVFPDAGLWPISEVNWVVASLTALSRRTLILLSKLFSSHQIHMVGHTALEAPWTAAISLCLPYMAGRDLFHILWWAINLVIPVQWLGIRLMNLPIPGTQKMLSLIHTFTLGTQVRH